MTEKVNPTIEDLQKRIEDMEEAAKKYRIQLEESVRSRPLESVAMFFAGGVVFGVLIGLAISRRQ